MTLNFSRISLSAYVIFKKIPITPFYILIQGADKDLTHNVWSQQYKNHKGLTNILKQFEE